MSDKNFLVTNRSEGTLCITGRMPITIPGLCKDFLVTLPEETALKTVSRLSRTYRCLDIRPATETESKKAAESKPVHQTKAEAVKTEAASKPVQEVKDNTLDVKTDSKVK